jgi:hypothetical protein
MRPGSHDDPCTYHLVFRSATTTIPPPLPILTQSTAPNQLSTSFASISSPVSKFLEPILGFHLLVTMFRQPLRLVSGLLLLSLVPTLPLTTVAREVVNAAPELDYCPSSGVPSFHDAGVDLCDELGQLWTEETRTAIADEFPPKLELTKEKKVATALAIFDLGL